MHCVNLTQWIKAQVRKGVTTIELFLNGPWSLFPASHSMRSHLMIVMGLQSHLMGTQPASAFIVVTRDSIIHFYLKSVVRVTYHRTHGHWVHTGHIVIILDCPF